MPDDAEQTANDNMDKAIEKELSEFDNEADDSNTDDSADDDTEDSATDSDDNSDEEDKSDDKSDDSDDKSDEDDTEEDDSEEDKSDDKSDDSDEVDFSVRDTPANIKNFVAKLERMTPEQRTEKIESLDPVRNKAELEAIKDKFPDIKEPEKFEVSKKDWDNVQEQLAQFKDLDKVKEARELYESLAKDKPKLEKELSDRMLQEKYGKRYEEVSEDPKFKAALKQYEKLDLPDRLAASAMHSKVAREILIEKAATNQNKLKALKSKKSSSAKSSEKKKYKHSITTEEGIQERFGDDLSAL